MTLSIRKYPSDALVLDYDDTLAAAGTQLDGPTSASLKRLRDRYLLVLATQRAGWSLPSLVDEKLFDWVVSDGGARIRRAGQDVGLAPLMVADLASILNELDRPAAAAHTLEGLIYEARYPIVSPHAHASATGRIPLGKSPVLALFLAVGDSPYHLPDAVKERLRVARSNWPGVLVVRHHAAAKLTQVRRILSEAGIDQSRVTSFGNSPHDDDLLTWTHRAFAVGQAPQWHAPEMSSVHLLRDHTYTRAALDEIYGS